MAHRLLYTIITSRNLSSGEGNRHKSTRSLIRWSGLSALLGGVLFVALEIALLVVIGDQSFSVAVTTSAFTILVSFTLVASALVFLGLVGLYARQAQEAGAMGLIAFLVAFIGTAMYFGLFWAFNFIVPTLVEAVPDVFDVDPTGVLAVGFILTFILFALGWLLFGLASLLTNVLPRPAAVLLMIGAVLVLVLEIIEGPFVFVVFGIALAWMGVALWSEKPATATTAAM